MSTKDWRQTYQDAFLAANGYSCEIESFGSNRYRIITREKPIKASFFRKDIIVMTENLQYKAQAIAEGKEMSRELALITARG